MNRIRVNWYFATGKFSHGHDYDSIESAFAALVRTGMDALAYPAGTINGVCDWRRAQAGEWTLEKFREKMEGIGKG